MDHSSYNNHHFLYNYKFLSKSLLYLFFVILALNIFYVLCMILKIDYISLCLSFSSFLCYKYIILFFANQKLCYIVLEDDITIRFKFFLEEDQEIFYHFISQLIYISHTIIFYPYIIM